MNDDQAAGGLATESLGLPQSDRPAAIKGISVGVVGVVQARSRGAAMGARNRPTGLSPVASFFAPRCEHLSARGIEH